MSDSIRGFFSLPRELRDEIYRIYCEVTPPERGALSGYAIIPSPAALRICKQITAELSPLFYECLKAGLLSEEVCITLCNRDNQGHLILAGWSIWTHEVSRRFNVWVRKASTDNGVVSFWVDVERVSPQLLHFRSDEICQSQPKIMLLWRTLNRLAKVEQIDCPAIRMRLKGIDNKVVATLHAIWRVEHERKKGKLRPTKSDSSGLRDLGVISFLRI